MATIGENGPVTGVRPRAGGPAGPLWTAPGFRAERLLDPNPLWASNGVAFGPDGRLYVAQFLGGTISALDVTTGGTETVLGPDGPLTAPDDLAFDDGGAMYVVDLPAELVWRRAPDGELSVVAEGIVAPDGIACHAGRLFVNELAPDGRLLEIDLDGGPPRVLATGLVLGNAMQVGPDGRLYYPHLGGGEVWRVGLDGGSPERVLAGLDRPVAVRFDPSGRLRILSNGDGSLWTSGSDGTVTDTVRTGVTGADNVAFAADGTAYVSGAFRGGIRAVRPDGAVHDVLPPGLNGPFGIAAGPDGTLVVADWFGLVRIPPGGEPEHTADVVTAARGCVTGVAVRGGGTVLTTDAGTVVVPDPGGTAPRVRATGLTRPTGIADAGDGLLVADTGGGRVVHVDDADRLTVRATGLDRPAGVAADGDGRGYVTESGRGRVVRISDGAVVAAGLHRPEGLTAAAGALWCTEAGTGNLVRIDPVRRTRTVVASGLAFDVRPAHVPDDCRSGIARRPAPFAAVAAHATTLTIGENATGTLLRLTLPD